MNTLFEPVTQQELEPEAKDKVWNFQYPLIAPGEFPSAREVGQTAREIRMQRAQTAALEAARRNGVREGEAQAEAAAAQKLTQERQTIARAVEHFAEEQRKYFRRAEKGVVTLTLAIARKLLHREAHIDPLLLSGVVRVALDQIQAGSQVVMRTSPAQQVSWEDFVSSLPETSLAITVLADEAVEPATLVLETPAGKAEISLECKLQEIESGFLDLLQGGENEFV